MRINVKSEGKNIRISLPTSLIFGRFSVWIGLKLANLAFRKEREYLPEDADMQVNFMPEQIPKEAIHAVCAELMRVKRSRGSFRLVEVYSAEGDEVLIDL